jgi:hypothetical protein
MKILQFEDIISWQKAKELTFNPKSALENANSIKIL